MWLTSLPSALSEPVIVVIQADLVALDAEKHKQAEAIRIVETSDTIVNSYKEVIRKQDNDIASLNATIKSLEARLQLQLQSGSQNPEAIHQNAQ